MTSVTKVIREVSHVASEAGGVNYIPVPLMSQDYSHGNPCYAADPYMVNFEHYDPYVGYNSQSDYPPHSTYASDSRSPHSPHSPSEHSRTTPPHGKVIKYNIILHIM